MKEELFSNDRLQHAPLAARMRPRTLDEYVGQEHILGPGKLLTRAVEADRLSSIVLYGPPGSGKTTLALCIAERTQAQFEAINAVMSNVEEMRKVLTAAKHRLATTARRT
ncbi:MAG: AAA family ATPase, partial [Candidatus Omnitrophica bacterium]|nr:AAA family ATPase [Candidatus Omnitrophota bacterium]